MIKLANKSNAQRKALCEAIIGQTYRRWWRGRTVRKKVTAWRRKNEIRANGLVYARFQVQVRTVYVNDTLGRPEWWDLSRLVQQYLPEE